MNLRSTIWKLDNDFLLLLEPHDFLTHPSQMIFLPIGWATESLFLSSGFALSGSLAGAGFALSELIASSGLV